jgi:2-polyprenyl-6-methoxyphenol hydroxylase-like FAD-dependent oxidoreductase
MAIVTLHLYPYLIHIHRYGYTSPVMARPDLIRILASRIPADKLHYNKRVIATQQDENQVTITCSDNTTYSGTILVGTDGAYSSIRQNMFKELESEGLMHSSDAEPMQSDYDCVVGVTGPMDTKDYPLLKEELCEFKIVMGKTLPMTVSLFSVVVGFSVPGSVLAVVHR